MTLDSDDSDVEPPPASVPRLITDLDAVPEGPSLHVVNFQDKTKQFYNVSPFKIWRWYSTNVGEIEYAKPLRSGALLIKVVDRAQALALLATTDFMGSPTTVVPCDRLNTVEALAHAPSLADVSDEDLLTELQSQGVIGVRRLRPRQGGKPNPLVRLKFRGHSHPISIRAGFEILELRLWVRPPLLCRRCARYGHGVRSCRSRTKRCLKCAGPHGTDGCEAAHKHCPHCDGPHAAWEHCCPAMHDQLCRAEEEQRRNAGPPTPPPARPTLADAVVRPRPPQGGPRAPASSRGRRGKGPTVRHSTPRFETPPPLSPPPPTPPLSESPPPTPARSEPPPTPPSGSSHLEARLVTVGTQTDPLPAAQPEAAVQPSGPALLNASSSSSGGSSSTAVPDSPASTVSGRSLPPPVAFEISWKEASCSRTRPLTRAAAHAAQALRRRIERPHYKSPAS